jgi:TonB family protein
MQPKALMLGAAEDRTTPKPGSLKVSTGVVAPKLTSTVPVAVAPAETGPAVLAGHRATVAMVVDTTGKPSSLSVVDSNDASLNTRFLDAVRQFRFKPGTVNGQPVAFPVNLVVTVK